MKRFNAFSMLICTLCIGVVYLVSTGLVIIIGTISNFFLWINRKLALTLIWAEREYLREKGVEYDEAYYEKAIDFIKKL